MFQTMCLSVRAKVRSGQQVYAEGASLVVMGSVNVGAEVLADGDIHVYGSLKGRAVAGLSGEGDARLFVMQFDPVLVGIGDAFVAPDDCPALQPLMGRSVCVSRLKESENKSAVNELNRVVVDCGDGKYLVVTPLVL